MTPMLQQFTQIKSQYPDAILFFRLGDFYEMFGADAELGARELSITLTSRESGKERLPMCGVPYHAAPRYVAILVNKGYKVAICEQMEDPTTAKGVVRREVTRVITPGTVLEDQLLDATANNYLVAVNKGVQGYGLAYADISTGDFATTQFLGPRAQEELLGELARLKPAELLLHPKLEGEQQEHIEQYLGKVLINHYPEDFFSPKRAAQLLMDQYHCTSLAGFGCEDTPLATGAAGVILDYLQTTQKRALTHLENLRLYYTSKYMVLDPVTRRNLELTQTLRTNQKDGSLFGILDKTVTAMGARLLRNWIEQPSIDLEIIEDRQGGIGTFVNSLDLRDACQEYLNQVYDLERLLTKVMCNTANARDLLALKNSLEVVQPIKELFSHISTPLIKLLEDQLDPLTDLTQQLSQGIHPEPPVSLREGNLIQTGYHQGIDELREICQSGRQWISSLEQKEKERTGIKSLKIGYNKVFGYYIEVTRTNLKDVPEHYQRKQTLANAERYITPELKEKEAQVLGADEKITQLEYEVFIQLRELVAQQAPGIKQTARALAQLDVLVCLAGVAVQHGYTCPQLHLGSDLQITQGRHPVVKALLTHGGFVPNDTFLNTLDHRLVMLTGPNMAGKSTYLRQVALIVLMAQMGSFVPAVDASMGMVDRIFTRVGASDDLATGQSTFMVEMTELANILNNASEKSLVIIDEVGRGTSTYDGMAISQAAMEYLHNKLFCRCIVSTHYHELTFLENNFPGVKNYHVQVHEEKGNIAFLYTVARGATDQSYGLNVARMAGIPRSVIRRGRQILSQLERENQTSGQLQLHELFYQTASAYEDESRHHELIQEILDLDINNMTPLEALEKLTHWQKNVKQEQEK